MAKIWHRARPWDNIVYNVITDISSKLLYYIVFSVSTLSDGAVRKKHSYRTPI